MLALIFFTLALVCTAILLGMMLPDFIRDSED